MSTSKDGELDVLIFFFASVVAGVRAAGSPSWNVISTPSRLTTGLTSDNTQETNLYFKREYYVTFETFRRNMEQQTGAKPRTPGAMNWVESIDYFIGKGKVSRAGLFDNGGKQLAGTPDLQITDQDAHAIRQIVDIPVDIYDRTKFGVFLSQARYVCLKVDSRTLVGMTKEELFVAHRCDNVMIIAFVPLRVDTSVSCLGEVWTFAEELKSHMEVTQFVQ